MWRRWLLIGLSFVLIATIVIGALYWRETVGLRKRNVKADFEWFAMSLRTGNDEAIAYHASGMQDPKAFVDFLVRRRESLTLKDIEKLDPKISKDAGQHVASFRLSDGASIDFVSPDGEFWTVHAYSEP